MVARCAAQLTTRSASGWSIYWCGARAGHRWSVAWSKHQQTNSGIIINLRADQPGTPDTGISFRPFRPLHQLPALAGRPPPCCSALAAFDDWCALITCRNPGLADDLQQPLGPAMVCLRRMIVGRFALSTERASNLLARRRPPKNRARPPVRTRRRASGTFRPGRHATGRPGLRRPHLHPSSTACCAATPQFAPRAQARAASWCQRDDALGGNRRDRSSTAAIVGGAAWTPVRRFLRQQLRAV